MLIFLMTSTSMKHNRFKTILIMMANPNILKRKIKDIFKIIKIFINIWHLLRWETPICLHSSSMILIRSLIWDQKKDTNIKIKLNKIGKVPMKISWGYHLRHILPNLIIKVTTNILSKISTTLLLINTHSSIHLLSSLSHSKIWWHSFLLS